MYHGPIHIKRKDKQIFYLLQLIKARERSTSKGTVFTGVCLFTFVGSTPSQVNTGAEVPISQVRTGGEVPLSQVKTGVGYPIPKYGWGVPNLRSRWGRYPHPRSVQGRVPPSKVWMGDTLI